MVQLDNFDAAQVDPLAEFEPLPAGKYLAVITHSELKDTKARTGRFLELTFEMIDGEFEGRKLWARLNLENPNATAVKIARAELSSICRAVGVMRPKDSAELHDLPLLLKVKVKRRSDSDELTNEIAGYERKDALNGKPVQTTSDTPPWRRN